MDNSKGFILNLPLYCPGDYEDFINKKEETNHVECGKVCPKHKSEACTALVDLIPNHEHICTYRDGNLVRGHKW